MKEPPPLCRPVSIPLLETGVRKCIPPDDPSAGLAALDTAKARQRTAVADQGVQVSTPPGPVLVIAPLQVWPH